MSVSKSAEPSPQTRRFLLSETVGSPQLISPLTVSALSVKPLSLGIVSLIFPLVLSQSSFSSDTAELTVISPETLSLSSSDISPSAFTSPLTVSISSLAVLMFFSSALPLTVSISILPLAATPIILTSADTESVLTDFSFSAALDGILTVSVFSAFF